MLLLVGPRVAVGPGFLRQRGAPLRICLVEWPGNLEYLISVHLLSATVASQSREGVATYIPKVCPVHQIWMVDLALRVDMLTRADHHGLGGCDVDDGRLARVCVRNP